MLGVQTLDLSVARAAGSPTHIDVRGATWVRFYVVDAEVNVRIDSVSSVTIPLRVDSRWTYRSCAGPLQAVYVDNAAGVAGDELVVVYGDASTDLTDFLG